MDLPQDILVRLVTLDDCPLDCWYGLLSTDEMRRIAAFRSERRKRMFVQGRVAARMLAADYLGMDPHQVPLYNGESGAPELFGCDLYMSIAHAGAMGMAAISVRPVGIDIECIKPRRADLYRYILSEQDYGVLEEIPLDHNDKQILLWTIKESVLKGIGTGFRMSPKKASAEIEFERARARVRVQDNGLWEVHFKLHSHFFVAVAWPVAV